MALHHKLCHVLGGSFGLPHSETHAVVLPHAAAYNAAARGRAARAAARGARRRPRRAPGLYRLAARIGAPLRAARLGLAEADLDRAAEHRGGEPVLEPAPGRARRHPRPARRRLGGRAAGGMSLEGREIAVIGAGIGGLAAAMALAQRGARVRSSSRRRRSPRSAPGLQVAPNGVAVLEALGLRDAAAARCEPARGDRAPRPPRRAPGRAAAARARPASRATAGPTGSFTAPTSWPCWPRAPPRPGSSSASATRIAAVGAGGAGRAPRPPRTAPGTTAEIAVAADGLRSGLRAAARLRRRRRRGSPATWPGAGWSRRSGCRRAGAGRRRG